MKTEYLKIDMNIVRKTINDKGFYYITADRFFDDHYSGPRLYIVTDNPDFANENPAFADMLIMTVEEFEPIAQAVNEYIGNEDRERHRNDDTVSIDEMADKIAEIIEDRFETEMLKKKISAALDTLNETQRRRIKMYFFEGKTQLEIARLEGVRLYAVQKSVESALKKIKKFF